MQANQSCVPKHVVIHPSTDNSNDADYFPNYFLLTPSLTVYVLIISLCALDTESQLDYHNNVCWLYTYYMHRCKDVVFFFYIYVLASAPFSIAALPSSLPPPLSVTWQILLYYCVMDILLPPPFPTLFSSPCYSLSAKRLRIPMSTSILLSVWHIFREVALSCSERSTGYLYALPLFFWPYCFISCLLPFKKAKTN